MVHVVVYPLVVREDRWVRLAPGRLRREIRLNLLLSLLAPHIAWRKRHRSRGILPFDWLHGLVFVLGSSDALRASRGCPCELHRLLGLLGRGFLDADGGGGLTLRILGDHLVVDALLHKEVACFILDHASLLEVLNREEEVPILN